MDASGAVGLFGKIPALGDFFRLNVADPAAQRLVGWLQEAIEPVYRARLPLPERPVRFLFRVPDVPAALVGTMVASADKVGRVFPLCAFVQLPTRSVASAFPAVPASHAAFLDAAEALLAGASDLDGAALGARARGLPVPPASALAAAEAAARGAAARTRAGDVVQRLFGDLPPGAILYALSTLETALRPLRGKEPARAGLVLDGPAETDVDLWAWLELARRGLGWSGPPPFFWTAGAPGRLVLSLGAAGPAVLVHLCDPVHPGQRVWPLRTLQPAAIEAARKAVPPAAVRLVDGADGSVEALVSAAAGR
jgi:type VI secretion system protein ImpM